MFRGKNENRLPEQSKSAIEPSIGHLKDDNRMKRNYLKGTEGDKLNAIFAAAGYNLRKLLKAFCHALTELMLRLEKCLTIYENIQPKCNLAPAG